MDQPVVKRRKLNTPLKPEYQLINKSMLQISAIGFISENQNLEDLCSYLDEHPKICFLIIENNRLTKAQLELLSQSRISYLELTGCTVESLRPLSSMKTLEEFHITNCGILEEGLETVLDNPTLAKLLLSGFDLTKNTIERLAASQLKYLEIEGGVLGDVSLLSTNKTLQELSLINCNLAVESVARLLESPCLKKLTLDFSELGAINFAGLAENTQLTFLSLENCGLTDEAIKSITRNPSLQEINLADNPLTDLSIQYLTRIQSLTSLNLSSSQEEFRLLTPDVCIFFLLFPELRTLNLSGQRIANGVEMLLICQHNWEVLDLSNCGVTEEQARVLVTSNRITELDLSSNPIEHLSKLGLTRNLLIETLFLTEIEFPQEELEALIAWMEKTPLPLQLLSIDSKDRALMHRLNATLSFNNFFSQYDSRLGFRSFSNFQLSEIPDNVDMLINRTTALLAQMLEKITAFSEQMQRPPKINSLSREHKIIMAAIFLSSICKGHERVKELNYQLTRLELKCYDYFRMSLLRILQNGKDREILAANPHLCSSLLDSLKFLDQQLDLDNPLLKYLLIRCGNKKRIQNFLAIQAHIPVTVTFFREAYFFDIEEEKTRYSFTGECEEIIHELLHAPDEKKGEALSSVP